MEIEVCGGVEVERRGGCGGEGTCLQFAKRLSVSPGFVKKILAQRKAIGSIASIPRPGRPPTFSGDLLKRLEDFVSRNHDATLAEIQQHLSAEVE